MTALDSNVTLRRDRAIELVLALLFAALFLYSVAAWLAPGRVAMFKPLTMVVLCAGLLLQPLAALIRPRFRALSYWVLLASVLLIVTTFFM